VVGLPAARTFAFLSALLFLVASTPVLSRWMRAVELLQGLSEKHRSPSSTATTKPDLAEEEVRLPLAGRSVRARVYRVDPRKPAPGLVLAHGVHYAGIDEKRLIPFARQLARAGFTVLTPELRDLADYRITRDSLAVLVDSARYLGSRRDWASDERVGLMGFSFAGGLSLVAATDPRLEGKLSFVTSVGGHHDLERVLRFFTQNRIETPRGTASLRAHEYGLAVLVYDSLDRFVPEEDRPAMQRAFKLWLMEDRPNARAWASRRVSAEAERLFLLLEGGRLHELGPDLEHVIAARRPELEALSSRGKLARARVPIHLLHGTGDTVIPPSETEWAAKELDRAPHDALVSPLLEHVEVNRVAGFSEQVKLIGFVAAML
jgi:dienelactone hydrolase